MANWKIRFPSVTEGNQDQRFKKKSNRSIGEILKSNKCITALVFSE